MRYRGATHYFLVCINSPGAVLPFSGYLMSPEECRAKGFPPGSVMLDDDDERLKQPQPQRQVTTSGAPPQRSVTTSGGHPQTQVSWVYLCASVSCVLVSSAAGVRVANRHSATVTWPDAAATATAAAAAAAAVVPCPSPVAAAAATA